MFNPTVNFQIAFDVENTLFGKDGAAFIYAKQKGASSDDIIFLDKGLEHIAEIMQLQTGREVANIPGAGAAGGVAAGLMAYFDCKIIPGATMVIDASNILKQVPYATLIMTGEGKLDSQSINGKIIQLIAQLGNQYQVPVIALCGIVDISQSQIIESGLSAAYQI